MRAGLRLALTTAGAGVVAATATPAGIAARPTGTSATHLVVALTPGDHAAWSAAWGDAVRRDGVRIGHPVFRQHPDWNIDDVTIAAGVAPAVAVADLQRAPEVLWAEVDEVMQLDGAATSGAPAAAAAAPPAARSVAARGAAPGLAPAPLGPPVPAAPPSTCTPAASPHLDNGTANDPLYCHESSGPFYAEQWNAFCFLPATQTQTGPHPPKPQAPRSSGICADGAWRLHAQGQGTVVAILDSGVDYTHPDLRNQMADETSDPLLDPALNPGDPFLHSGSAHDGHIHGWNFYDDNAEPMDYFGHGTGRAGIAAAQADNGIGLAGIAPRAHILAVKVGDTYVVHAENMAEGVVYAADHGADSINASLGITGNPHLLRAAAVYAYGRGVVWANATANEFSNHHNVASNIDTVVGAGGLGPDNLVDSAATCTLDHTTGAPSSCTPAAPQATWLQKVNYANYGGIIEFAAPIDTPSTRATAEACGGDPFSAACAGRADYTLHNGGTSTATPHIAAAADVVRSAGFVAGLCQGHPNIGGALTGVTCTGPALSSNEVRQLLAYTALRVRNDSGATADYPPVQIPAGSQVPGSPSVAGTGPYYPEQGGDPHLGWNQWAGYGRPDLYAAAAYAEAGLVPPEAQLFGDEPPPAPAFAGLHGPAIFGVYDPATTPVLPIIGHVAAPRAGAGQAVAWQVQVAPCLEPAEGDFTTIATGTGPRDGVLARWHLPAGVGATCANHGLGHPFSPAGTTTIRVLATIVDGGGTPVAVADPVTSTDPTQSFAAAPLRGQDRRVVTVRPHAAHDHLQSPYAIGASAEGSPALYDLEGRGELDVVQATSDGTVAALRPDGTPVPGWPVAIDDLATSGYAAHPEAVDGAVPRGQIVSAIAIGEIGGDGRPVVVASSFKGGVYAWYRDGSRLPGFPVSVPPPPAHAAPPIPFTSTTTKDATYCSTPHPAAARERYSDYGSLAAPVLADVEGRHDGSLDIVQAAANNCVYAIRPDGTVAWAAYPHSTTDEPFKIAATPAVGSLAGDGRLQVVLATEEVAPAAGQLQGGAGHLYALDGRSGAILPGWPVALPSLAVSAVPTVASGIITSPALYPTAAGGSALQAVTGSFLEGTDPTHPVTSRNADGSVATTLTTEAPGAGSNETTGGGSPGFAWGVGQSAVGVLTDAAGRAHLAVVGSGFSLDLATSQQVSPGLKPHFDHLIGAWDLVNGDPIATFPRQIEDWSFLSGPVIADVRGDGAAEVVAASGEGVVHALDPAGSPLGARAISTSLSDYTDFTEPAGFPVQQGGQWVTNTPAVGQLTRGGPTTVVDVTREGWVFMTDTAGRPAADNQWWRFHHDERNSGLYGLDTRPPATVTDLTATRGAGGDVVLRFTDVGDDWWVGTAAALDVRWSTSPITDASFYAAHRVGGVARPGVSGGSDTVVVTGTPPDGTVYYAVRAVDAAGNVGLPGEATLAGTIVPAPPGGGPTQGTLGGTPNTTAPSAGPAALPGLLAAGLAVLAAGRRRTGRGAAGLRPRA